MLAILDKAAASHGAGSGDRREAPPILWNCPITVIFVCVCLPGLLRPRSIQLENKAGQTWTQKGMSLKSAG